jgi:hypothetical protein
MAIWDEQLSYIIRTLPVTVGAGQSVEVRDADPNGEVGVGVSRWFGWLDGVVYKDTNNNGKRDPGEPTIGNTDMDQRWRDGSIKESTFTDPSGHYEYPTPRAGRSVSGSSTSRASPASPPIRVRQRMTSTRAR